MLKEDCDTQTLETELERLRKARTTSTDVNVQTKVDVAIASVKAEIKVRHEESHMSDEERSRRREERRRQHKEMEELVKNFDRNTANSNDFRQALADRGVHVEFDGALIVPRALDVYRFTELELTHGECDSTSLRCCCCVAHFML
jgi:hypothetical protein